MMSRDMLYFEWKVLYFEWKVLYFGWKAGCWVERKVEQCGLIGKWKQDIGWNSFQKLFNNKMSITGLIENT